MSQANVEKAKAVRSQCWDRLLERKEEIEALHQKLMGEGPWEFNHRETTLLRAISSAVSGDILLRECGVKI